MDADKEGFLRCETSLIQTIGRSARNADGHVIMYADKITDSMKVAIEETKRRRKLQMEFNKKHGITPKTIKNLLKTTYCLWFKATEALKILWHKKCATLT